MLFSFPYLLSHEQASECFAAGNGGIRVNKVAMLLFLGKHWPLNLAPVGTTPPPSSLFPSQGQAGNIQVIIGPR